MRKACESYKETAARVPDAAEVGLLWRNDYEPGRVFNRRLEVEAGRVQPFSLLHDPNWVGRINGLALAVKGVGGEPVVIQGATAKTMSPREILGDRIGEWFTFEPWNGASINTLIGGAGNDILIGGPGNDTLSGDTGTDLLVESGDVNFTLTDNALTGVGTDSA